MVTRSKSLLAAAAVLALGAGSRGRDAAADVPTAPPPREKAAPVRVTLAELEEDALKWREKAARSKALLRSAEEGVALMNERLRLTEDSVAKGRGTAADRDVDRATLERFREMVARFGRDVAADAERYADARDRLAFATRRNGADVTGTLAVDVVFPDADRPRVARAARDLLMATTTATADLPAAAWDAARRLPHLHVRFPTPHRELGMSGGPRFVLAEALFPLPLTRDPGGYVLVRNGDRVVRLSGFFGDAHVQFQKALSAAVPAGR